MTENKGSTLFHKDAKVEISPEKIYGVIFDMDGVITQTADVHAIAWKRLFDDFLKKRSEENGEPFVPFDSDLDYNKYVDGKPRQDGIISFLHSRGIEIPLGSPDDGSKSFTVYGMGAKKNGYFLDHLAKHGINPFPSTVELIKDLKRSGIKVAVISSSKNCKGVLEGAGVLDLFDARVDGIYSQEHHIKGKPAPDIFLEAAEQLGVEPEYAIVIEDAISGVEAGSRGGFALTIGVDRVGQAEALKKHGADVVVKDLAEVTVIPARTKPHAMEAFSEIKKLIGGKEVVFFLDYDGTMTPIVSTPSKAILAEDMRRTLKEVTKLHKVAIISGRDRKDVQKLVGIGNMFYAGSHGYDIAGPEGQHFQNDDAENFVASIDEAEKELREKLAPIEGAIVERKRYGVAAHYRTVDPSKVKLFCDIVESIHHRHLNLRKATGKKVFELQPKINWNKGKALLWLQECLGLNGKNVIPIYIGDDVTDEDAFKVLAGRGIGIAVQEEEVPTYASYVLKNPQEVQQFLQKFIDEGYCG